MSCWPYPDSGGIHCADRGFKRALVALVHTREEIIDRLAVDAAYLFVRQVLRVRQCRKRFGELPDGALPMPLRAQVLIRS